MPSYAARPEMTRVMPLVAGLMGIHSVTYEPTLLFAFDQNSYMDWDDAVTAQTAGDVEILVENSRSTLTPTPAPTIPIPRLIVVRNDEPDLVVVVFNQLIGVNDVTGFSITGTSGTLPVSIEQDDYTISIRLNTAMITSDVDSLVYDDTQTSDLRSSLDSTLKTVSFTEVITNEVV